MKKLFLIFLCGGLFFSASAVFAEQKMMVNEDGEAWLTDYHQWEVASEAEMRAYRHPGVEVPVEFRDGKPKKAGFFHYIPVQEYSEVIVWNGEKFQTVEKVGEEYGESVLAWHIIFLLVAMIFMVMLNIATKADKRTLICVTAVATIVASFFAVVSSVFVVVIPIIFATAFLVVFTAVAAIINNKKKYKIFSVTFYLLSFIVIIIWLTT